MIFRKIEIVSLKVVALSMIENYEHSMEFRGRIIYSRKFYCENFVYVNYFDILNFI